MKTAAITDRIPSVSHLVPDVSHIDMPDLHVPDIHVPDITLPDVDLSGAARRTRRMAAAVIPWMSDGRSNRNRWIIVAAAVAATVAIVVLLRRGSDDSSSTERQTPRRDDWSIDGDGAAQRSAEPVTVP